MCINRPSLYAAFGNKEVLFKQAFDLYQSDRLAYVSRALDAPSARVVARNLLEGTIDDVTGEGRGCLGDCLGRVQRHPGGRLGSRPVRPAMVAERLQRAVGEGDWAAPVGAEALTHYLIALFQGIAVQAAAGASREQLLKLGEAVLASARPGR